MSREQELAEKQQDIEIRKACATSILKSKEYLSVSQVIDHSEILFNYIKTGKKQ